MLQAQGLQPIDPYRTLQVLPHAPRDLIDEAYYALAARANASAAAYARLRDLNDAYALLTSDERRERYDAENGHTRQSPLDTQRPQPRKPLLPMRRQAKAAYAHRHYDVLAVDSDASAEVIDIAYRILSRKYARSRGATADAVAAIDEAYHTLGNPHLRAQYDANLPPRPVATAQDAVPATAPASPNGLAPGAPPRQPTSEPRPASANTDIPPLHNVERGPGGEISPAPADETPASTTSDIPPLHNVERGAGGVLPPPHLSERAPDGEVLPPLPPWERGPGGEGPTPQPRRLFVLRAADAPAGAAAPRPARSFAPVRGLRALLRRRRLERQAALEAMAELSEEARARLVDLRDGRDAPNGALSLPPELLAAAPGARSLGEVTFLEGPYAGRSVAINDSAIVLGDLDPLVPEYGRVSPYGGECMLRQAPGIDAIVNGQPLGLPLAFLDDGDDIRVGPHHFRFDRAAAVQPIPIESLQSS